MTARSEPTEWRRYGTKCRTCGAQPYSACLSTRIAVTAVPMVPKVRPHKGRYVTERRPYPREAAVRAAATRIRNWKRRGRGRLLIKVQNWQKRDYHPSYARKRQIGRENEVSCD